MFDLILLIWCYHIMLGFKTNQDMFWFTITIIRIWSQVITIYILFLLTSVTGFSARYMSSLNHFKEFELKKNYLYFPDQWLNIIYEHFLELTLDYHNQSYYEFPG